MKKTVLIALGVSVILLTQVIADKCFKIPPPFSGQGPDGVPCGRRAGDNVQCTWEEVYEGWFFLGRYCLENNSYCKNHDPSGGPCTHLLDLYGYGKIYRCIGPDDEKLCNKAVVYRPTTYGVTPTGLDCQGHRCRGKDSFVEPAPDDAVVL